MNISTDETNKQLREKYEKFLGTSSDAPALSAALPLLKDIKDTVMNINGGDMSILDSTGVKADKDIQREIADKLAPIAPERQQKIEWARIKYKMFLDKKPPYANLLDVLGDAERHMPYKEEAGRHLGDATRLLNDVAADLGDLLPVKPPGSTMGQRVALVEEQISAKFSEETQPRRRL